MPAKIFFCYAHEDRTYLNRLKKHLTPLHRENLISSWSDANISPGAEWEEEIQKNLETAQIILLLVSPDFIASDYCYSKEMLRAMERHDLEEARVIPILLRPTDWKRAPFGRLQALPTDAKPITDPSWVTQDRAFIKIADGIRNAIDKLSHPHAVPEPIIPENTQRQAPTNSLSSIEQLEDPSVTDAENVQGSPRKMSENVTNDETFRWQMNRPAESLPINVRLENSREEFLWRYYASHALGLSLLLICDELPGNHAGILLPLRPNPRTPSRFRVEDLGNLGESLVGWLGRSRSSHTLFTPTPSFQYPTDYSLLPLAVMQDDTPLEEPKDRTLIVLDRLDRRPRMLSLSEPVVETIRLLLAPLYEEAQKLRSYFGHGMRDDLEPAPIIDGTAIPDPLLDGLADMVVRLGGRTTNNQELWHFCCILLPKDPLLPLQKSTLIVRAQSEKSPHEVGITEVNPAKSVTSLSMRAYQSGNVLYRSEIAYMDASIDKHRVEKDVKSAIAIPIGGENGSAMAVLYVASKEKEAFSESQQRVLRMVCRMIEEALLTYRVRQQVPHKLRKLIDRPRSVDPLFEEDFLSENDFVNDVTNLLTTRKPQIEDWHEPKLWEDLPLEERKAQYRAEQLSGEVVSFIAVDIDNHSTIATKYGNQVAQNLSRAVGLRMKGQQHLFASPGQQQVYHMHADRFYLLLEGIAVDEARDQAERLRNALSGEYRIDAHGVIRDHLRLPQDMLAIPGVTVRVGVASYGYGRLKHLLQKHSVSTAVVNVRAEIMRAIDVVLDEGSEEGGNIVISWDVDTWGYTIWPPTK